LPLIHPTSQRDHNKLKGIEGFLHCLVIVSSKFKSWPARTADSSFRTIRGFDFCQGNRAAREVGQRFVTLWLARDSVTRRQLHLGNQERPPHNAIPEQSREKMPELARGQYAGFNDSHCMWSYSKRKTWNWAVKRLGVAKTLSELDGKLARTTAKSSMQVVQSTWNRRIFSEMTRFSASDTSGAEKVYRNGAFSCWRQSVR
jgi:hypothetical protein